jgi:ribosome maturation factor RimP
MEVQQIKNLVDEALQQNESLYLIDLKILPGNKIYVEVDGDNGITLQECIRISRAVEHNLDRELEDFSLEVTSPDIANPLQVKRQYKKNINRTLLLQLLNNKSIEGVLKNVSDNGIDLEWKTREPKPVGKGKITVVKNEFIPFENIVEAKVKIIF